jgi:malate dehydrogenase (oxaloacetate-decarboxylating)
LKPDEKIRADLSNIDECFPADFTPEQTARTKTLFFKKLAISAHRFYGGKIQMVPKAPVPGTNWFNAWYTPGVSAVSTAIRDDNAASFELTSRGNMVAVVSDGTRVLGDGNVTPSGGLGVMEGKAFLMKYLAGVDAVPLCIDSRNEKGENDPQRIIEFVKRCQHSFGAINLEDISQPNCYRVLDVLRDECDIPVWHDDAQGTGCVILAGLINAMKLADKKISESKIVFFGAGAANSTVFRLVEKVGGDPGKMIMFDIDGSLGKDRKDIAEDERYFRQWDICQRTNPKGIKNIEEAIEGSDVLVALSKPGPDTIKPEWIRNMSSKPIVFACANPVPEVYPHTAKEAGAFIVATGRGDFPNQVNNSMGFPGILKGALLTRAKKITDHMAIAAARALAEYADKKGLTTEYIIPTMDETKVFPLVASKVAEQAMTDGVARLTVAPQEVIRKTSADIEQVRKTMRLLTENGLMEKPAHNIIQKALAGAIDEIRKKGR